MEAMTDIDAVLEPELASTAPARALRLAPTPSVPAGAVAGVRGPNRLAVATRAVRNAHARHASQRRSVFALAATDACVLALAILASAIFAPSAAPADAGWAVAFAAGTLFSLWRRGLYGFRLRASAVDGLGQVWAAATQAAIGLVVLRVLAGGGPHLLGQGVRVWAFSGVFLCAGRLGAVYDGRRARREMESGLRTLIVGSDEVGHALARRLVERPDAGLDPVGFLDSPTAATPAADLPPLIGTLDDFDAVLERYAVEQVLIAFPEGGYERLVDLLRRCRTRGVRAAFVPRLLEEFGERLQVDYLGAVPIVRSDQVNPAGWLFTAKYAVDRAVAALALVVLAPVMLLIAALVRLTSPGLALYRQPRVGRDGRTFDILKFRTMRGDAAPTDGNALWAAAMVGEHNVGLEEQDRRTAVGKLLRKWSLDELPQLINVLRGDMSFVGPRPERTDYVPDFERHIHRYNDRHRVKSGITGWAQVQGLRGETSLSDRVEWDNYYIENWSWRLDAKIMLLTLPAVVGSRALT